MTLSGLWKRFGAKVAVAGLDLRVPVGTFLGLVGRNGAGKTTALSMATGLLRPDAGRVDVLGHDLWGDPAAAKALIGVLPDGVRLFDRLTGRELLVYQARLRGIDRLTAAHRAEGLLDAVGLAAAADTLVMDYSAGMAKKIALAGALVHGPRVLVLDEPFEALDPVSAATIRQLLLQVVDGGGTVVLSSHVMEVVERLCDRVAVIDRGRVVASGSLDEIRDGSTLEHRFVDLVGGAPPLADLSWIRG
jgi:ABC-2 type transport system ATP-binding protein